MSNLHPVILERSQRPFVMLVGADVHHQASICHSADREFMHIEAISPGVLRLEDVRSVDVILAWDQSETLCELKAQLAILDCWSPIIAISRCPTVPQVVRAMLAGAVDFLEWPCRQESMREAVSNAMNLKSQFMPRRDRALKARRCLEKLTRRERQVLTEMTLGMSSKAIAKHLDISPRTVEIHRANLLNKLEAKHSADAIRLELEASLLAPEPESGLNWPAPWSLRNVLN